MSHAAVLTGDLIGSTRAGAKATDAAIALIQSAALGNDGFLGSDLRFARYRGDGWQIYCSDATRVYRLVVLVLATLHSRPDLPRTRVSAACGTVASLPQAGLASASGDAFTLSGRGLDSMGRAKLVYAQAETRQEWKMVLFRYLEWQAFRWSPEQAQAIAMSFRQDPPHPAKSAEDIGISRQAFSARLDGAGYAPLWDAEQVFRREGSTAP